MLLAPAMERATLSVFVDESGRFQFPDALSRFYILTLVLHDQRMDIGELVSAFDRDMYNLGIVSPSFHAGPIIRQEKGFELMTWELRGRIFSRMLAFARKADFKYRCLHMDKKFVASERQIVENLERQLQDFVAEADGHIRLFDNVKVYYDSGQATVTNMLHRVFDGLQGVGVEFAQKVRPENYKLFQVADLMCTLRLITLKIETGLGMSRSEHLFFGGPRNFLRNIVRPLRLKKI